MEKEGSKKEKIASINNSKNADNFETNIENIDNIIRSLESGELTLDDSIREYEKAMKLLKKTNELLNKAQGKIIKVTEDSEDDLILQEV